MSDTIEGAMRQAKAAAKEKCEPAVIFYDIEDTRKEGPQFYVMLKRQVRGMNGIVIVETVYP